VSSFEVDPGRRGPAVAFAAVEDTGSAIDRRWAVAAVGAVARHPSLWPTAARQALVLAAPGWWRRRPFLPLPTPEYMRFRLQTAYGGEGDGAPEPSDLVTYLHWCRGMK
jgi:hypothetical protein